MPAHFAAIALNPEMKFKYFESERESRADWIENGKGEVRKLWEAQYKPPAASPQEQRLRIAYHISAPPASAAVLSTSQSSSSIAPIELQEDLINQITD